VLFKMKINKKRVVVGAGCIILAALIAFIGIPLTVNSITDTVDVLRATSDIRPGDMLSKSNCKTIKMNKEGLPKNYLTELPEQSLYSTAYIGVEGFILESSVTKNPSNEMSLTNIPSGKVAISFTMEGDATSFDNQFKAGDIVQFLEYHHVSGTKDSSTNVNKLLNYVKLISVNTEYGVEVTDKDKDNTKYKVATVIVTPEQAQEIVRLEQEGNVHLVLIYRGEVEKANSYVVAQDEYLKKLKNPTSTQTQTTTGGENTNEQ
jgi:pilus assembly protein CpaB